MKREYPISFTAEMVRAILEGRKTQTRRLVDTKYLNAEPNSFELLGTYNHRNGKFAAQWDHDDHLRECHCPYGKPGDQLWVRESFILNEYDGKLVEFTYQADGEIRTIKQPYGDSVRGYSLVEKPKTYPSSHMPRWASRIQLEITDIRVERVQDISPQACLAEGITTGLAGLANRDDISETAKRARDNAYRAVFSRLWDSINAKRGFGWDANPWVWVIKFEKMEGREE